MKKILVLVLSLCTMAISAQKRRPAAKGKIKTTQTARKPQSTFVKEGYKFDLPAASLNIDGDVTNLAQFKDAKAKLHQFTFPNGMQTVVVSVESPTLDAEFKEIGEDPRAMMTWFWSGQNLDVVKQKVDNSTTGYVIKKLGKFSYEASKLCGAYVVVNLDGKDYSSLKISSKEGVSVTSGIYVGQSIESIRKKLSTLKGLKFENIGNEGGYSVYVAKWFQITDDYVNIYGRTQSSLNNDKEYYRFYFDAQGKLRYWYQTI